MIRLILVSALLLAVASFFLQNLDREVTLRYFFGFQETSTLIYLPVLSAFGIGLLIAMILVFPPWVRGQIELRRKNKALLELEADLEQLRESMERVAPQGSRVGARDRFEDVADE